MKSLLTGICTAAALALSLSVFAQTPSQPQPPPSQPSTPPSTQQPATQPRSMESSAEQVTLTGCVQSEDDYRRAKGMAKGGPASSGVGTGNEFVIVDASKASSGAATPTDAPAGTTGAAGSAFEATGSGEGDLKQYVGKRVEITGKIKRAERSGSGAPTGGMDPAGQDLQLQEIDIASVKPATGECKPNQ
jgi:hypothetical protein